MKKELSQRMRPFRARIMAEALLRAACISGVLVLPVWLLLALAQRLLCLGWTALPAWMMLAWVLLFAAAYLLRYRVREKDAARRMDALCGMDRIATAVEFAGNESVLCRLQREDAARRLASIDSSALHIALPVPAAIACLILAAMIAAVPRLPQSMTQQACAYLIETIPGLRRQESEEAAALRGMIEALRSEVESGGLEEANKNALLARLDEMLVRLDDGYVDIAALQDIQTAMHGMQQTVRELTPRDTYMAAMIEFESLRLLGEAIYDQNIDVVTMILESLGRQLHEKVGMEQVNALMDLVYDIQASLAKPVRDNSQEQLRQGMMMFAGGLETAAEMVYNNRDNTKMIDAALDTVETYIRDYLGVEEEGERYDPYANRAYEMGAQGQSSAALDSAVQEEKPLSRTETEYIYNPPAALQASSYTPGALNESGQTQRIRAEERERPTGAVPYGEVYGSYYAQYLDMLSDESFPQALRETAETYMNGL